MRIAIATVQVPLISGGAEVLSKGLAAALQAHGHQAELVTLPFRFAPESEIRRAMTDWAAQDFNTFDVGRLDRVICLKFPSYYLQHPAKVVWLLHQHRAVYELFDTPYGASSRDALARKLRDDIQHQDSAALSDCHRVFTIAQRVSQRLHQYNGVASEALYHPPQSAAHFYCGEQLPYIFFPSRLEALKRQELLIRAMALVRSPVCAIFAGEGGSQPPLEKLIAALGLHTKVRLLGRVNWDEMLAWYANSLAVFFGPFDEDYGYVTLEAMLAAKPVITCNDSGGPLEFVVNDETGCVVDAQPEAIADAIDRLYADRPRAARLGRAGQARYRQLDISWQHVVNRLLA